jgi:hypothetical protein
MEIRHGCPDSCQKGLKKTWYSAEKKNNLSIQANPLA